MSMDFSDQRLSYEKTMIDVTQLPKAPLPLLQQWLQEAIDENSPEPYAMSLATCGRDGQPAVRIVLLREMTDNSLVFYTNYDSEKGRDIADNPKAEALFFWHEMQRQIRVRGLINKVEPIKSEAYFNKRPKDSQLAAWVSDPQSGEVNSREVMEKRFDEMKKLYANVDRVPKPKFWGGYELVIDRVEFWQGRASRMHDRIVYSRQDDDRWQTKRLLP